MELKQRKKINNIPKFNSGTNLSSSVKGIGGDITGMGAYKQQLTSLPTIKEINGMKTPSTSLGGGGTNLLSSVKDLGGDITGMRAYKQQLTSVPTRIEINGMRTPGKLSLGSGGGEAFSNVNADAVTGAVNGTIGMIQGYNSMQNAVKRSGELMAYSGQRTDQAFGVNYQAQNDINGQKAMDDISKSNKNATLGMVGSGAAAGAAIGSAIPGVGTLIGGAAGAIVGLFGGLFGSKKARERQRRKIFNAQQKVNLINQVNQSSAATEGLTQQYYLDNGNTYDDLLYANRGKDLRKPRYVKWK